MRTTQLTVGTKFMLNQTFIANQQLEITDVLKENCSLIVKIVGVEFAYMSAMIIDKKYIQFYDNRLGFTMMSTRIEISKLERIC